ncbi:hypothetical protein [Staphylococcus epidermidis]|uniref:hypothetical protein n=1 Tax=Staphylococcus epidermidis TaxID=1282 RepID=UPI001642AA66|nr:hypothetical protein [Staphylococcus epidermidis]
MEKMVGKVERRIIWKSRVKDLVVRNEEKIDVRRRIIDESEMSGIMGLEMVMEGLI